MKRKLLILFFSLSFILFSFNFAEALNKSKLPDFMDNLVFKSRKFSNPIRFCVPYEDSQKDLNEIRTTTYGIAKLFSTDGYTIINKDVLNYLIINKFAYMEWAKVKAGYGVGKEYYFLFYTDKFKNLSNLSNMEGKYCLKVGKRILKSIDYKNEYKGSPSGIEMKFYAITFSYFIEGNLPELPPIKKVFKGKAKAYMDPDDGEWKLANFNLSDLGDSEYISQIQNNFSKYDHNTHRVIAKEKSINKYKTDVKPKVQPKIHKIQSGESLYSISRRYGLTVQQLRDYNNLEPKAKISPGQELKLIPK
jgi:LysM repeat protein